MNMTPWCKALGQRGDILLLNLSKSKRGCIEVRSCPTVSSQGKLSLQAEAKKDFLSPSAYYCNTICRTPKVFATCEFSTMRNSSTCLQLTRFLHFRVKRRDTYNTNKDSCLISAHDE